MDLNPIVTGVVNAVRRRSGTSRAAYLERVAIGRERGPAREHVSCANLAHAMAAQPASDKLVLREAKKPNIAIVSSYNDMLSAHQPLAEYPALIKQAVRSVGAVAQFAGGVPAMCDGITQGRPGMELSLFSRDVIAQATAIALCHDVFDAVLCLGVCDKIVPGLLIGALHFGHLPAIFVPAGPMTSGMSNGEKAKIRQLFAQGRVDRTALLEAESSAYHGPGTCTFYGTANSNQMLMEVMGLHIPGSAFVTPNTPLRGALTSMAARRVVEISAMGREYTPISDVIDERAIVNGIVGLLATGGSTNHTMHLVAIARAAGIVINWDDFDVLSEVVPTLAHVYPNGQADINHFHAAGGMGFLIGELIDAGLLDEHVRTVAGGTLRRYAEEPLLEGDTLRWRNAPADSLDKSVLRSVAQPFSPNGGLRVLRGNLGRAVIKISAVEPEHRVIHAAAIVFDSADEFQARFAGGELARDFVAILRFQGPRANGMPELHQLTPALGALQDQGFRVALVTDGRMSGASGKIPAAIHVTPEALRDGALARVQDGDPIVLDANAGLLYVDIDANEWAARAPAKFDRRRHQFGMGRELFESSRRHAGNAEEGATTFGADDEELA